MRTLISCVGSANYKKCKYRMADGSEVESSLFSAALVQVERQKQKPIERIVFLGTTDSGWDTTLVELMKESLLSSQEALSLEERISKSISKNAVDSESLKDAASHIGNALGVKVELVLVPRALTPEEQENFSTQVLELIKSSTVLHVDVTHGYRHWPFLLSQIAFLAVKTIGLHVERFSYGFLPPGETLGQEVVLDTFVKVSERTAAAAFFKDTWDARTVKKMLTQDRRTSVFNAKLDEFTHMLAINNLERARHSAHQILCYFEQDKETCKKLLSPFFELIKTTLETVSNGGKAENWENDKIFFHGLLEQGDFFRAIMFLWESWLTKILESTLKSCFNMTPQNQTKALHNLKVRQCMTVWAVYKDGFHQDDTTRRAVKTLNKLRNFVAHGGIIRNDLDEKLKSIIGERQSLLQNLITIEKTLMKQAPTHKTDAPGNDLRIVLSDELIQF
jgi:CRISPR-associated Csx2 family protein